MSSDERKDFEILLKEDKDFKKEFDEHKALFNAFKINEAQRLKDNLKAHEPQRSSKKRFTSKPVIYSIAAIFMVLLGSSVYFNFFQQDFYKTYFEPYPNVYQPVVRGNEVESTEAFMHYENKAYEKAQISFEVLLQNEEDPNIRFYYALSFLNNNQPLEAIVEFEKLRNIKFEFQAEVLWYQALAEIKLEKFEKAESILKTLQSTHPEYKKKAVEKLIGDL
jgi:tetratricopeptide (TPR) repeat protein